MHGLVLGTAWNAGPTWDSTLAENPGAWAVWTQEIHTALAVAICLWQTQCGPSTMRTPHACQWYLFTVFLPPHNTTEQVSLNKWPPLPPCVRAEIRHQKDLQTEEAKINKEGELLWKWQIQQLKTLHLILETVHLRGTYKTWEQVQAGTRDNLTLNWTHTAQNSSKEIPRDNFTIITF